MSGIQKTHFADDATLARINQLERELAEARQENKQLRRLIDKGRESTVTELGLAAQVDQYRNAAIKLLERAEKAEARCREFESDARRYRWLRDECDAISNPGATWILDAPPDMWDDGIDAAIDAAIAREGESHE